jgi:hypothetical protein
MSLLSEPRKTYESSMLVNCWHCDVPMRIKTIEPTMLSPGLDEIVYGCPTCISERKQTVMRTDTGLYRLHASHA